MKTPPWLGHLRTDRKGRPVPFINRWGDEDTTRLSIRWDHNVGMPAVFHDDSRETEPDFFHQDMARQRQCMAQGLCQVCGRPVPWRRRLLVVSSMSTDVVDVNGLGPRVVIHEPWLDVRCAEFALTVCPGLLRRKTADDLSLIATDEPEQARLTVSRGWIEGPLEAESRRVMPAMWLKVMIPSEAVTA